MQDPCHPPLIEHQPKSLPPGRYVAVLDESGRRIAKAVVHEAAPKGGI